MLKKYNILIVILLLIIASDLSAQHLLGKIKDQMITGDQDTIIIERDDPDYWIGIMAGMNMDRFYNSLFQPMKPEREPGESNPLIDYPASTGFGYFAGVNGEWIPPGNKWGASLHLYLADYRSTSSEAPSPLDTLDEKYISKINLYYLGISPTARYNLAIPGLYLIGGFEILVPLSWKSTFRKEFINSGDITQDYKLQFEDVALRYGFSIGAGYEIFMADIENRFRAHIVPFITINGTSEILKDWGSNWTSIYTRIGLKLKFGKDNLQIDTLEYDPYFRRPPPAIAVINVAENIDMPGFSPMEFLPALELKYVEKPEIIEEISEKLVKKTEEELMQEELERKQRNIPIVPKQKESFTFATSSETTLPADLRTRLDIIADYMKSNPNTELRIEGHSDNTGTYEQNYRRSQERANTVQSYLIRKGVPRNRLFARARGAVEPVASNESASGRKKNRRVELVITQGT